MTDEKILHFQKEFNELYHYCSTQDEVFVRSVEYGHLFLPDPNMNDTKLSKTEISLLSSRHYYFEEGLINNGIVDGWSIFAVPGLSEHIIRLFDFMNSLPHDGSPPQPEWAGFYHPYHLSVKHWGIYLIFDRVAFLASLLTARFPDLPKENAFLFIRLFLLYHFSFHHYIENFCTTLEIAQNTPFYLPKIMMDESDPGNEDNLEETVASAKSVQSCKQRLKNNGKQSKSFEKVIRDYLLRCNLPTRPAANITSHDEMQKLRNEVMGKCHALQFPGKSPARDLWSFYNFAMTPTPSLLNRTYYLLSKEQ